MKQPGADRVREAFERRYGATLQRLADEAPREVLEAALAAEDEFAGLAGVLAHAPELLARAPDPLTPARSRAREVKRRLVDDAGGVLEAGAVARLLGVSPQAVHQRRKRGTLLAVEEATGQWLYPAFQFEPPSLANRIGALLVEFTTRDPWTRLSVLLSPAPSLGGARPVEALRGGDLEGAAEAVRSFGTTHG
jgi:hypothetical protein